MLLKKILYMLIYIPLISNADVIITGEPISFYKLASMEESINGKSIILQGWVGFYKYENENRVLLYPSKEKLKTFSLYDAISIDIDSKEFHAASEYLNNKFVTVYATYKKNDVNNGLFGSLLEITDIDIIDTELRK